VKDGAVKLLRDADSRINYDGFRHNRTTLLRDYSRIFWNDYM